MNVLKGGFEPGLVLGLDINYKEFGSEKIQLLQSEKIKYKNHTIRLSVSPLSARGGTVEHHRFTAFFFVLPEKDEV